jgi:hypothetical protein
LLRIVEAGGIAMKFIRKILVTILLIAAFAVGAAAGDMLDLDLLPLDKATYDMEILKEQITEISEMATLEYRYSGKAKYDGGSLQLFGKNVPFTAKSMLVYYEGIVKLGSDLSGIEIEPGQEKNQIVVTIPHSKILSHEIDENTWEVLDVKNGLFNRVTLEDNGEFVKKQKKAREKEINKGDLPKQADEKMVSQLTGFLTMAYPDIEVEVKFK